MIAPRWTSAWFPNLGSCMENFSFRFPSALMDPADARSVHRIWTHLSLLLALLPSPLLLYFVTLIWKISWSGLSSGNAHSQFQSHSIGYNYNFNFDTYDGSGGSFWVVGGYGACFVCLVCSISAVLMKTCIDKKCSRTNWGCWSYRVRLKKVGIVGP